jgi:hypothetical protein
MRAFAARLLVLLIGDRYSRPATALTHGSIIIHK